MSELDGMNRLRVEAERRCRELEAENQSLASRLDSCRQAFFDIADLHNKYGSSDVPTSALMANIGSIARGMRDDLSAGKVLYSEPADPTKWTTLRSEVVEVPRAEDLVRELNRLRRERENAVEIAQREIAMASAADNRAIEAEGRLDSEIERRIAAETAHGKVCDEVDRLRDALADVAVHDSGSAMTCAKIAAEALGQSSRRVETEPGFCHYDTGKCEEPPCPVCPKAGVVEKRSIND